MDIKIRLVWPECSYNFWLQISLLLRTLYFVDKVLKHNNDTKPNTQTVKLYKHLCED